MMTTIPRRLIPDEHMAESERVAVRKTRDSLTFGPDDAARVKGWLLSKPKPAPSRGLGDTVAKLTKATGIDRVVKKVTGGNCGCEARRQKLNELVPYKARP